MKNLRIRIYGRVQGVGFRYETRDEARRLGLTGFARNEPDGSVYIEAEGKERKLNAFLELCKRGPTSALIEKIEYDFRDETKNFSDFRVEP